MYNGGYNNGGVDWEYLDKFEKVTDKYMPARGEGDTMASQIVTAINKLVYKWYNDGDVYDNTHVMEGWCNDLSSYANWLAKYTGTDILDRIEDCYEHNEYEHILKDLADTFLDYDILKDFEIEKQGTIYECDGQFRFVEEWEVDEW